MTLAVLALVVGATAVVGPMALTALGQHRRALVVPASIVAGLFFPVTWIVWYLHDERPYPTLHH